MQSVLLIHNYAATTQLSLSSATQLLWSIGFARFSHSSLVGPWDRPQLTTENPTSKTSTNGWQAFGLKYSYTVEDLPTYPTHNWHGRRRDFAPALIKPLQSIRRCQHSPYGDTITKSVSSGVR